VQRGYVATLVKKQLDIESNPVEIFLDR